ncbi:3-oxoacyl-[acyl-carrier-protein] synthase III C-terminal domain-containing protein [Lewinella sp. LCG006]|uniref:3-oxoacyl-[acyl-carrier-protein] synthase III C-terminal domain-containing protein n=1 Tax=Lewinella sp. LCG006 TaxID=3231911 RepID=UPI00345F6C82
MPQVKIKNIHIEAMAAAVPDRQAATSSYAESLGKEKVSLWEDTNGISSRYLSSEEQTASDLGFVAANAILADKQIDKEEIGVIIVATSTPDYRGPATACVLHGRLGLSIDCIAFDLNLGDCGFVIGLQTASSILATTNKQYALLITGDTTSMQLDYSKDSSLFFGDAASAVLLKKDLGAREEIIVETGVESTGYDAFMLAEGGFRDDARKNNQGYLQFSEEHWWSFLNNQFTRHLNHFLSSNKHAFSKESVLILPQMGNRTNVAFVEGVESRFSNVPRVFDLFANTRGATIPLVLAHLYGKDTSDKELEVVGTALGEGMSWGLTLFSVTASAILPIIITAEVFAEGSVAREI